MPHGKNNKDKAGSGRPYSLIRQLFRAAEGADGGEFARVLRIIRQEGNNVRPKVIKSARDVLEKSRAAQVTPDRLRWERVMAGEQTLAGYLRRSREPSSAGSPSGGGGGSPPA